MFTDKNAENLKYQKLSKIREQISRISTTQLRDEQVQTDETYERCLVKLYGLFAQPQCSFLFVKHSNITPKITLSHLVKPNTL